MPTTLAISGIQAMVCLTATVPYTFVALRVETRKGGTGAAGEARGPPTTDAWRRGPPLRCPRSCSKHEMERRVISGRRSQTGKSFSRALPSGCTLAWRPFVGWPASQPSRHPECRRMGHRRLCIEDGGFSLNAASRVGAGYWGERGATYFT